MKQTDRTPEDMIDFKRAFEIVTAVDVRPETEKVPLLECLHRVLAVSLNARLDQPPFSKAAMDGFAISSDDNSSEFRIVETIAAGDVPKKPIRHGQCARIMTGAMMPQGADKVVRVEFTSEHDGVMKPVTPEPLTSVIRQGENIKKGEPLMSPRVLRPQDIGILAEKGIAEAVVAVRPKVGVVTTGSELAEPGQALREGWIYNSNAPQLCNQVAAMGLPFVYHGGAADDPATTRKAISEALADSDVLLLSGGVSMGDFDFVPRVLAELGVEILFHRVAVKPGKPTLYGKLGTKSIFGLPGNPVSTFVIFEVLVKPHLYSLMRIDHDAPLVPAVLAQTITRRSADRLEFLPVVLAEGKVSPLPYHGSSHLHAFSRANALITFPPSVKTMEEGTEVHARQI